MLCGASDTQHVRDTFTKVITEFGGEAWHYQRGEILHINSMDASWSVNSLATLQSADLAIFVIWERYGSITWATELAAALAEGKPFRVLCLDTTYQKYLALSRLSALAAITDESDRMLVSTIRELEFDRQLTVVPFGGGSFGDVLRRQLGTLFAMALKDMESRNKRRAVATMLTDPTRLTTSDLGRVIELALDEFEDKNLRKRAIQTLADCKAADEDTLLALLSSVEQGVQRLTVQKLPELYVSQPAEREFFDHCVQIANDADDVGIARRLIPALLDIELRTAVEALAGLTLTEVGTRRRLAEALERHEDAIGREGLVAEAFELLARCLGDAGEAGWKQRCRAFQERLGARDADDPADDEEE